MNLSDGTDIGRRRAGIWLANLNGGDLGLPSHGFALDGLTSKSIGNLCIWTEELLQMRKRCHADEERRPVCAIDPGPVTDAEIVELAKTFPIGVEILTLGGVTSRALSAGGVPTGPRILYLFAP